MTFLYPDVSNHNPNFTPDSTTSIMFAKATEGTTFADPLYWSFRMKAQSRGMFFGAYHWFLSSNITAQATWAFQHVGVNIPLMLDCEDQGSSLQVGHIIAFVNAYRSLGGVVNLIYLPHWYWQGHMGSPDLSLLNGMGLHLVASEYRAYSDTNWPTSYGGMTPFVWQFTDNYQNQHIDYNACRAPIQDFISTIFGSAAAMTLSQDDIVDIGSAVVQWATRAGALPAGYRGAHTNLLSLEAQLNQMSQALVALDAKVSALQPTTVDVKALTDALNALNPTFITMSPANVAAAITPLLPHHITLSGDAT